MPAELDLWRLAAGLGLFLFGMHELEEALKRLAGRSFKRFLRQYTAKPVRGIVAGAAEQEPPETSSSSGEVDPDAESFRRELKAAQEEEEDKERRTYRGIDTKGGRYGFGENVDDALDATTNPDSFLFGGFLFVIGAVVLFLFGPRPPSELYY